MSSTIPTSKIVFKENSVDTEQSCKDESLIEKLKDEGKLNPDVNYNLACDVGIAYTIGRRLGEGSFNDVYEISDAPNKVLRLTHDTNSIKPKLDVQYNMKVDAINPEDMTLHMENIMQTEITGLFLQSYLSKPTTQGGIECPFICKVYEFGYVTINGEKRAYAILEKVTTDLYKYLQINKKTSNKISVKNIFKQVLQGLRCMHANNYLHLDIKPENIGIMDAQDTKTVKIFDFGMAMYIDPKNSSPKYNWSFSKSLGFTPQNSTYQRGTPFYMDPFLSDKTDGKNFFPSKKSDVYSVGAMMLETYFLTTIDKDTGLLTSPVKIRMKHWEPFYRSYYDSNENVALIEPDDNGNEHSPLKTLLKNMIDHNPEKRYTVDEILSHEWFTYVKNGGKRSRKLKKNRSRKAIKKRRQSSFVKSRRVART